MARADVARWSGPRLLESERSDSFDSDCNHKRPLIFCRDASAVPIAAVAPVLAGSRRRGAVWTVAAAAVAGGSDGQITPGQCQVGDLFDALWWPQPARDVRPQAPRPEQNPRSLQPYRLQGAGPVDQRMFAAIGRVERQVLRRADEEAPEHRPQRRG